MTIYAMTVVFDCSILTERNNMSIFQVAGGEKEVDDPANSNQVKSDAGNVSIAKITDNNTAPVGEDPQEVTPEGKNPMIVIDGPLGRAYTQALNLAYAKEDTGTIAMIAGTMDKQIEDQKNALGQTKEGTYVYVLDGGDISQKQCVETTNWLFQQQAAGHKDIVISLEGHMVISPRASQIENIAKSTGAKVVYNKKSLMKHVKDKNAKKK